MARSTKPRAFEAFEIGSKVAKRDYEAALPDLRVDLVNAQYDLDHADFSVLVLLVGDDRKGVNELIDVLHEWMDARYLITRIFILPRHEELEYPAYWRYWRAMPPRGRIGIHVGAWPLRAIAERLGDEGTDDRLSRRIEHMRALERCLGDDGTLLIKLWLHVPRKEALKRLKKAGDDPDSEPYIGEDERDFYRRYREAEPIVERVLSETSTDRAPWHVIESTNPRHRNLTAARVILNGIQDRLAAEPSPPRAEEHPPIATDALAQVDLSARLRRAEYKERLTELQARLNRVVREARGRVSTVIALEGWDAAGKGGVIRRLTSALFAQDYRVFPVAAPSDEERARHYLWRFWRRLPRDGGMAIFDRSWYGRVLVERVEGFASPDEWQRAYREINDFEAQLIEHGTVLCKFWLHIDPEEQLRRFEARERTAYKKYKITDEDYRNRDRWSDYTDAVNEMVARTSTESAPWHLVSANQKRWARVRVLETVVGALSRRLEEKR